MFVNKCLFKNIRERTILLNSQIPFQEQDLSTFMLFFLLLSLELLAGSSFVADAVEMLKRDYHFELREVTAARLQSGG